MNTFEDKDALARIQAATDYPLFRGADGWVMGRFFHCRLSSLFQPLFDGRAHRVVGHSGHVYSEPVAAEADARESLSPWGIFALAADDPVLVRLDRLCRTLHALNYFSRAPEHLELHLAVQPRLLESVKNGHGRAFERVLDLIGVETSRVVIELPAEINGDRRLFRHVTANYRSRGYRIACNHGGHPDDWMADLGSLYPDIARVDVRVLRQPGGRALADAIRRFGATLLATGIDAEEDLGTAMRAGAGLLQGNHLGEASQAIEFPERQAARSLQASGRAG
jgi:EAL domain-containing protein (putative c-di-GMP-specific phosphodiesterase class I)